MKKEKRPWSKNQKMLFIGLIALMIAVWSHNILWFYPLEQQPPIQFECVEWEEMPDCEYTREAYICHGKCFAHTNYTTSIEIKSECYPPCKYLMDCDCTYSALYCEGSVEECNRRYS